MKRLRVDRLLSQLLAARTGAKAPGPFRSLRPQQLCVSARHQSTAAAEETLHVDVSHYEQRPALDPAADSSYKYPSPDPARALKSAKLAALHARLGLSPRVPHQTLARTLVDASADENPYFNNSNLAFIGQTLINYHVAEWLMCRYPRLPQQILYSAMKGYAGPGALHTIARQWGVEAAAVPGGEVDPGLLQFNAYKNGTKNGATPTRFGMVRTEAEYIEKYKFRRGVSSRVVYDDDYGDMIGAEPNRKLPWVAKGKVKEDWRLRGSQAGSEREEGDMTSYGDLKTRALAEKAYANAVRAVVGAIYAHCGRETAKSFIKGHILSRTLDLSTLFAFQNPTRELALLCAREDFEAPVARLLSETGRLSRTPVFVVGIFSGKDKLGEAAGPNLDHARNKAAMNSLKAWYLYSPGEHVRAPSDMLAEGAKPWEPAYIDIGEIVSR